MKKKEKVNLKIQRLKTIMESLSEKDYIQIYTSLEDVFGDAITRISINIEKNGQGRDVPRYF